MEISFVRTAALLGASTGLLVGCSVGPASEPDTSTATSSITLGGHLSGISDADFAEARDNFNLGEAIDDGVGPVFNETACGNCHTNGAQGGAGEQIERRYGRVSNGIFSSLSNEGGSLRQLKTLGTFINDDGRTCTVPLEVEPADATVRNVGRLTTPLFGLGLVDAMPDSFFQQLVAAEPANVRGTVVTAPVLLPNPADASQRIGTVRVARFGWKAVISNLPTFAADAYINEMGITTQHCFRGTSITTFATESAPNGRPMPSGCDDLAPPQPAGNGVPAGTDDAVGSCDGGLTEIQEDIQNFITFMTFLAPPERDFSDAISVNAGAIVFNNVGCNGCHVTTTFRTPNPAPNGVPGGFAFNPFSDFAVHDMGSLGDGIGNDGDTVAVTRRMRTAPLWGIRFRNHLLHDGRTPDIGTAIRAHDGQGLASAQAFGRLSAPDQHNLIQFVRSL
jgi:CxxC motif-containing protein (DUF1111 family)